MAGLVDPHPHFAILKEKAWDAFFGKDYEECAKLSARILQDSFALDAIHLAGLSLTALDRNDEGFNWLCASLSLADANAEWYGNAAIACLEKKDYVHAMVFLEQGIKDHPKEVRLHYMRGLCMCHTQTWDNGIRMLDETLALDPTFYHANMSKGFCLHMLGRYDEAIECYRAVYEVATGADREEAINNHACVLLENSQPHESLALLEGEYPNSTKHGTVYNKSFLYLGMGDWPKAWDMYRLRATVQINGDQGVPVVDQPTAKTFDEIKGKSLFLFHEQGLGDTLQFIRYAQLLQPHVSELIIGVPKALKRIAETLVLERPFTVVSDSNLDKPVFTRCDVALPMLDAPAILQTTTDTIPNGVPYFNIPDAAISANRLPDTCKPLVGLCWAGASRPENIRAHNIDKRRSVPFAMLEPILVQSDRLQFVSLQLPDHKVDDPRLLQPLCADMDWRGVDIHPDTVIRNLAEKFDVLDTAAIIAQLDMVITIDSAVMHMAAAIGKPTWMLSRYDNCWRWFWPTDPDDPLNWSSPWYPTLRMYRQKAHHTWPEVIERVAADLASMTHEMDFLTCRLTT